MKKKARKHYGSLALSGVYYGAFLATLVIGVRFIESARRDYSLLDVIFVLVSAVMIFSILHRAVQPAPTAKDLETIRANLRHQRYLERAHFKAEYDKLEPVAREELLREAGAVSVDALLDRDFDPSDTWLNARVQALTEKSSPPPWGYFLARLWLILVAFACLPLWGWLLTEDIVSSRSPFGALNFVGLLMAVAVVYGVFRGRPRPERQNRAAVMLFGAGVVLFVGTLQFARIHHPYLFPGEANGTKIAAERVLAEPDRVAAELNVHYVFDYAKQLAEAGDLADARTFYQAGLAISPWSTEGHLGLAELDAKIGDLEPAREEAIAVLQSTVDMDMLARAQKIYSGNPMDGALPRYHVGMIERFGICLVPMGDANIYLIQYAGIEVAHRLGIEVYLWDRRFPMPKTGFFPGAGIARQWDVYKLVDPFNNFLQPMSQLSAIVFIGVTADDLGTDGKNYVFATSWRFLAIISYHRFGQMNTRTGFLLQRSRLVKQIISSTYQALGLQRSTDPRDVTAYPRSLEDLDLKSPDLGPVTRKRFDDKVREIRADLYQRDERIIPKPPSTVP